jgi:multiple antibiotic resistance protein
MFIEFLKDMLGHSVSIFTVMNPFSAGVIMLTLIDEDATRKEFHRVAFKNSRAVFISMILLFLMGTYIFSFFGIKADGLRIFGGIVLLFMGFNMVQGHGKKVNHRPQDQVAAKERDDISVVPLAIPIIVGPGLATTLITLSIAVSEWYHYLSAILAIVLCSFTNFMILKRMPFIKQRLGTNGLKVFNRLMGLIVGSLAVQMLITGILGLYKELGGVL